MVPAQVAGELLRTRSTAVDWLGSFLRASRGRYSGFLFCSGREWAGAGARGLFYPDANSLPGKRALL
jgi:hypothetical protein